MLIKICPICGSHIDYSVSDIHYIPNTSPQKVGTEGFCIQCSATVYTTFEAVSIDIEKDDNEKIKYRIENSVAKLVRSSNDNTNDEDIIFEDGTIQPFDDDILT